METEQLLLVASAAAQAAAVLVLQKRKNRSKRKLWSKSWLQRREQGRGVLHLLNNELLTEDTASYRNYLRLSNEQFEILLTKIELDIIKQDTVMRTSISARNKLELTLRFLASGETYRSLMYATRIHETTISRFVPEVCKAIYLHLRKDYITTPCRTEAWEEVAADYWNLWQFPNCLGTIDGRHIKFRPPRSDGSYYFNYKGDHSIILLGLSDAKYRFLYVNLGCNGRVSDGDVFRDSNLFKSFDNNVLNFPISKCLPNSDVNVPHVIIGDDAFPLSVHLMKPYPDRGLTHDERIYNYRLSRARRVVENAFGILANRFRILLNPINLRPCKVVDITLACVPLHNFLASHSPKYLEFQSGDISNKSSTLQKQGGNRSCNEARAVRNEFKQFFSTIGAVPWQDEAIARHNL